MADLYAILGTGFIPLVSFTSVSIYLFTHPVSPLDRYFKRLQLPVHRDEALDGTVDKDAFDIQDEEMHTDGYPVQEEKFWYATWRLKVIFWWFSLAPLACAIAELVLATRLEGEALTRALLSPLLIIPSCIVILSLGWAYLSHSTTDTHWNTTIHLAVNAAVQFLVLATLALLPSQPFPGHIQLASVNTTTWTKAFLPLTTIPPLLIILSIRRGPPLHFPLETIYTSRVTDAIPLDAECLNPDKPNVSEEVQATIPEWLLYSYATNVVRRGAVADTMDVWDLPVLPASMRKDHVNQISQQGL